MPRTDRILARGEPRGEIADTLLLRFDDRRRQHGFVFGSKGTCVEFDFPASPCLRTDDVLVLDDGRLAEVVAEVEPVLELRAKDFAALARLLLALGNRHIPVEVLANRVRVLRTTETEELIAKRGLAVTPMMAPFDPDGETAYDHDDHDHHDHDHAHHDHGHVHAQERDHGHGHGRPHEHGDDHGHSHEPEHGHRHDREAGHK